MGMAKIVTSELAPDEEVTYALGGAKPFKLASGGSVETDDPEVITNANAHPWLDVEFDPEVSVEPLFRSGSVDVKNDALAGVNSKANDPKAVAKAREEFEEVEAGRVAIESGTDQAKVVEVGDVAVTLAAEDAQDDSDSPKGNSK